MDKAVQQRFNDYPQDVQPFMVQLRELIFELASELALGDVTETTKWGEPSYHVKTGSPVRMDWKLKTPNHYYLYFNCQTKLVDTFRQLYESELEFQGNRAIVMNITQPLPEKELRHCLTLALTYKRVNHLPLLGA